MNEAAFSRLFETYKKQVYGYVLTLTRSAYAAEEITQDLFIKLWLCRDTLDQIGKLDSYIFSMAHNRTINYLRQASSRSRLHGAPASTSGVAENNIEERIVTYDYQLLIQQALETLTPQRKLVYQLSRAKGMKQEEIAAVLRLSPHTVKNHLVEALRCIRRYLLLNQSLIFLALLAGSIYFF